MTDHTGAGDADAFLDLLPHRPPFLLLDHVDACEPGVHTVARWYITGDEAWLPGHFPGHPIVPGVLQLEALAQAGAVAVLADDRFRNRLPLFAGVERARFRRSVHPGDELLLDITVERLSARGGRGHGTASTAAGVACEATVLFVLAHRP